MKYNYTKLLVAMIPVFLFSAVLSAQQNSEAENNSSVLTCGGNEPFIDTGTVGISDENFPELLKKEKNAILERIRTHSAQVVAGHSQLIQFRTDLKKYYAHTLHRGMNIPDRGKLVIDVGQVVFNFSDSHELSCVVLDNFYAPVERPENYNRRMIRIFFPDVHNLELITEVDHKKYRTQLSGLTPEAQIKALRKMESVIGSVAAMIDVEVSKEEKKQSDILDWQVGY